MTWGVDDATGWGGIANSTYSAGVFNSAIWGYQTDTLFSAFAFKALIPAAGDVAGSATVPLFVIQLGETDDLTDPNSGNVAASSQRANFHMYNGAQGVGNTSIMYVDKDRNTIFKSADASPSATAVVDINGDLRLRPMAAPTLEAGTFYVRNSDNHPMYYDGSTSYDLLVGGIVFTNGITESSGTVKLGGSLSENTTITGGAYTTSITSNVASPSYALDVQNVNATGHALRGYGNGSGTGVRAASGSGYGLHVSSNSGIAMYVTSSEARAALINTTNTSTNGQVNIAEFTRNVTSASGANGVGQYFNFQTENTSGTLTDYVRLSMIMTTATASSEEGRFRVLLKDAGTLTTALDVDPDGVTTYGTYVQIGGTTGPKIFSGSGSPEGVVTAVVGSLYTRTDGGAGTTLYVEESGAGNTGWVAK